jgi:hypothetical protein
MMTLVFKSCVVLRHLMDLLKVLLEEEFIFCFCVEVCVRSIVCAQIVLSLVFSFDLAWAVI